MAYYLGYKKNDDYYKIDLNIENSKEILSILKYTLSFQNESQLLEELYEKKLIPETNVKLVYLIEKSKNVYSEVPGTKGVYTAFSNKHFDPDYILSFLKNNCYDKNLYSSLLLTYSNKYGVRNLIKKFILKLNSYEDKDELYAFFDSLIELDISKSCEDAISSKVLDDYNIDIILNEIFNDKFILYKVLANNSRNIGLPRLGTLSPLISMVTLLRLDKDKDFLFPVIEKFVKETLYPDDKLNERELFDLGAFVDEYFIYLINLKTENMHNTDLKEYEEDEFLQESDFARVDSSSEEIGIKLHEYDGYRRQ